MLRQRSAQRRRSGISRLVQTCAAATAALFLTGFGRLLCTPPDSFTLVKDIYGQEQSNWCWAASGALVMNTIHSSSQVTQCEEANRRKATMANPPAVDCCTDKKACNFTGLPPYDAYSFHATTQPMLTDPDDIRHQLYCQHKPIAYVRWTLNGSHMLAIVGYGANDAGVPAVLVNDPIPVGQGSRYYVTYEDYSPTPPSNHKLTETDYDVIYQGP